MDWTGSRLDTHFILRLQLVRMRGQFDQKCFQNKLSQVCFNDYRNLFNLFAPHLKFRQFMERVEAQAEETADPFVFTFEQYLMHKRRGFEGQQRSADLVMLLKVDIQKKKERFP